MSGFFEFLSAIFEWLTGRKKSTETEIARHDQAIAEKQAADLTDHTQPATAERLSKDEF